MAPWIEVQREDQGPEAKAIVTLMPNAVAFNSHFMRSSPKLQAARFATVLVDDETRRVGFRFTKEPLDNSLSLSPNSRKGNAAGRVVQAQALMSRCPWLRAAAAVKKVGSRRFVPTWDSVDRLHYISLRPSFEHFVTDESAIDAKVIGIYRYRRGEETVYIGQGVVRSRASQDARAGWSFDRIEFSVVADEADRLRWEAFWIDEHRRERGSLPEYNRIGGRTK